ncbi:MAG: response regulator transcription factor [Chloroflexi bacterium]|nr:response regulator transcription factor [Chloroflexota bacterium]
MRVLLVDDHALFRAGLSSMLNAWGWEVVAEANNGAEAISMARQFQPDVVFMDINMPGTNGLQATRAIKSEFPETKVVMLTVSDNDNDLFEAVKSGAEGYLLKSLRESDFEDLVVRLGRGEPVMSPSLARKLIQEFARLADERRPPEEEAGLTARESEVLEQVTLGSTNKEVASVLFISENTVNYHMKNILAKLHLRNRSQVVAWAAKHGLTGRSE